MNQLTRIKPALGRVILQSLPAEERTDAGIWLPQREQDGSVAKVVAVCDPYYAAADDQDSGAPAGPMYQVGDYVLIGKYNGVDITLGREKFIALRESDIIGTLHPAEAENDED